MLDALWIFGSARSAGRPAEWPGASWLAASLPWAPWLARFVGPGRFWLALAASMWPRAARSGCPGRSGWLALDAQGALGSPWLANDCPIDAISKKNRFAFRRSCFDAACFVRSGTFLHASNRVDNNRPHRRLFFVFRQNPHPGKVFSMMSRSFSAFSPSRILFRWRTIFWKF